MQEIRNEVFGKTRKVEDQKTRSLSISSSDSFFIYSDSEASDSSLSVSQHSLGSSSSSSVSQDSEETGKSKKASSREPSSCDTASVVVAAVAAVFFLVVFNVADVFLPHHKKEEQRVSRVKANGLITKMNRPGIYS